MEPYAFAYLDDIIVSGASLEEHQFFIADMWRRMEQHPGLQQQHPALLQQRPAAPSAAAPAVAAPAAAASGAAAPANQH
ncbi:hypothetical protein ACLKA7_001214 [Drosophila subpalustris]